MIWLSPGIRFCSCLNLAHLITMTSALLLDLSLPSDSALLCPAVTYLGLLPEFALSVDLIPHYAAVTGRCFSMLSRGLQPPASSTWILKPFSNKTSPQQMKAYELTLRSAFRHAPGYGCPVILQPNTTMPSASVACFPGPPGCTAPFPGVLGRMTSLSVALPWHTFHRDEVFRKCYR